MRSGTLIDYQLKLFGIRFQWRTLIESFEPEARFVDIQITGPYRRWHHVHEFKEVPGGTLIVDRVDYEMPLGSLGHIAHWLSVRWSLKQVFDYRETKIRELFGDRAAATIAS
jgi:hypothetical protein